MKSLILTLASIALLSVSIYCQNIPQSQNLKQYRLENGLSVFLNEDNSVPDIAGAVVIKTGAKYDPVNATGTAHYLEHMLFKGTDKLGTIDYESEKIYLDSIQVLYDKLAVTESSDDKSAIQIEINRLSQIAGKYAIPNELDKVLDEIGATNVNAFTSDEVVAYFNVFPKNQIEKWLKIYSHRFQNPVFRLFQSELETVFEEKNMYDDNFITALIENFYANLYKNHPYGQQTTLGKTEHIKNPSLSTMQKIYDKYYVANNMALIISGNFNSDEVIPLIEKYFSNLKSGEIEEYMVYPEKPFMGVERISMRLSPVRIGILGFRTVPKNHEDEIAIQLISELLNNNYSTGYLNRLSIENNLLEAMAMNDIRNDHGAMMVIYVPKLIGQSFKKAEKLVLNEILRIVNGDIDPEFFESVKLGMIKDHNQTFENTFERLLLIAEVFYANKEWNDVLSFPLRVEKMSIEHIQKVAAKYFGNNYLSFQSKMGFPKKEKLDKPGFDPIIPENTEQKSEFAKNLASMKDFETEPEFIDFEKNLIIKSVTPDLYPNFYYVQNDVNDIFKVQLKFYGGSYHNPMYDQLAEYLNLIGTKNNSHAEFNKKLQSYACSFYAYAENSFFIIEFSGFNKYLNESSELIAELLNFPLADKSKLKNLRQTATFSRKFESRTPAEISRALYFYGIYGEKSPYLRRMSQKQIKKIKDKDLLDLLAETLKLQYSVHYSGSIGFEKAQNIFANIFNFKMDKEKQYEVPAKIPLNEVEENTILFLDDPKSLQSSIYFFVNGGINNPQERAMGEAFNKYYGSGMSSLVFQEVREFRSMAYAAYGMYRFGTTLKDKGYLQAYVGTQSDKTIDAVELMTGLIIDLPHKKNRLEMIKSSLVQSINSSKPTKRELSTSVESWLLQGYPTDPRKIEYEVFESLEFDDILDFYRKNVAKKPILICITGNKANIDIDKLSEFGKIIYVTKKDIFN